jgi:inosine-uridine nucleoside N-ribohydrolase
MSETIPVLFDTDIGSDIDDAVALAYLLKQERCELVGITTVTGDTVQRAAMAEIVCRAGGREDMPIHAGLTGPFLHGPGQPAVPQFDAIKHLPHRTDYAIDAVDYLRETIRSRPGEITLLAVGPMTNIAALFVSDPEIPSLLKRIVLMCGVYRHGQQSDSVEREWNALVDPIATGIVYKEKLLGVGLDVTLQVTLPAEECRQRFTAAGGALGVVGDAAEVWFKHSDRITFHDPLAATLIFEPDLCHYAQGAAHIHTDNTPSAGKTEWQADESGAHTIAVTVDAPRFLSHYFEICGG